MASFASQGCLQNTAGEELVESSTHDGRQVCATLGCRRPITALAAAETCEFLDISSSVVDVAIRLVGLSEAVDHATPKREYCARGRNTFSRFTNAHTVLQGYIRAMSPVTTTLAPSPEPLVHELAQAFVMVQDARTM